MNIVAAIIVASFINGFITQLIVRDEITVGFREWLDDRQLGIKDLVIKPRPVAAFANRVISCYRCAGVWFAIPSTLIALGAWPWSEGWHGLRTFAGVAMSASFVQYAIMRRLDQGDQQAPITINNSGGTRGEETQPT